MISGPQILWNVFIFARNRSQRFTNPFLQPETTANKRNPSCWLRSRTALPWPPERTRGAEHSAFRFEPKMVVSLRGRIDGVASKLPMEGTQELPPEF
jgi:hypothetical protein